MSFIVPIYYTRVVWRGRKLTYWSVLWCMQTDRYLSQLYYWLQWLENLFYSFGRYPFRRQNIWTVPQWFEIPNTKKKQHFFVHSDEWSKLNISKMIIGTYLNLEYNAFISESEKILISWKWFLMSWKYEYTELYVCKRRYCFGSRLKVVRVIF